MNDMHPSMLDHPCLDAERAANAFEILAVIVDEVAQKLGTANSQYCVVADLASWLGCQACDLRRLDSEDTARAVPAVGLRLVL